MADQFGISFQPSDENAGMDQPGLQEAVKLLNLRLPSVIGARSPVAPQLLQATGMQGQPDMQFLRQLLGLAGGMGGFGGMGMGPQGSRLTDGDPSQPTKPMLPHKPPPPPHIEVERPRPTGEVAPEPYAPRQPRTPPERPFLNGGRRDFL